LCPGFLRVWGVAGAPEFLRGSRRPQQISAFAWIRLVVLGIKGLGDFAEIVVVADFCVRRKWTSKLTGYRKISLFEQSNSDGSAHTEFKSLPLILNLFDIFLGAPGRRPNSRRTDGLFSRRTDQELLILFCAHRIQISNTLFNRPVKNLACDRFFYRPVFA